MASRRPECKDLGTADRQDGSLSRDLTPVPAQPNDTTDELPHVPTFREVLTETIEAVEQLHNDSKETTGVPAGFPDLDRLTSGLQLGNLIVISARPGVGKTTLALDCARNAAIRAGVPTLLCSLELNRNEVSQRLMSAECTIDLQRLRTGRMEDSDWTRLVRGLPSLAEAPLWVDDTAVSSVATIRAQADRLRRQHGLGMPVVDGIQALLSFRPLENLYEHISFSVRGLKLVARELNIPCIVTSPVSRQTEARSDHRPMLNDLSGLRCN